MRLSHTLVAAALISMASLAVGAPSEAPRTPEKPASKPITADTAPVNTPAVPAAAALPTVAPPAARASINLAPAFIPGYGMTLFNGGVVEQPADVEQAASCVFQVDGPAEQIGFVPNPLVSPIVMLLGSSAFCDPAIVKTLKLPTGAMGRQVLITAAAAGHCVRLEVSLKKTAKSYEAGAADALLKELLARLPRAMAQSVQAENRANAAQVQTNDLAIEAVKKRLARVSEGVQSVQEALAQPGGYGYGGNATGILQNLRAQKEQARSELRRLRAQLAELGPQEPEAVAILQADLKANEARLTVVEDDVKVGKAKPADVEELRGKIAEDKAQLATAKEAPAEAMTPQPYAGRQVRQIKTQFSEVQARLRQQEKQITLLTSPEMSEKLAGYADLQQEEQRLRQELNELAQRASQFRRTARERVVPTITVLDGN